MPVAKSEKPGYTFQSKETLHENISIHQPPGTGHPPDIVFKNA
jgi:hypothetical protein